MAKRFTDSDKWKDPWFEDLSGIGMLFFFYYLDNCDCAGIWKGSFKQFCFMTKFNYTPDDMLQEFGGKVVRLKNGSYFMPSFIKFQYGALSESNNAHKGVLKSLNYNDIQTSPMLAPAKPHASPCQGAQDKDKDKDKDKDNTNSEQCINKTRSNTEFAMGLESSYKSYSFTEGYPRNIFEEFALEAYPIYLASNKPDKQWLNFLTYYIKNNKPKIQERMRQKSYDDLDFAEIHRSVFASEDN